MEDEIITDTNLICNVCGESRFALREGFYYCEECGTKQEQVRAVEVEHTEDFMEGRHLKKQKIKTAKAEKPNLTSWECYNYILRGFVNELLSFGAKEELKLMTLQLWAAYLRRSEVAFFNKKRMELPKLGIRYLESDATALYNHASKRHGRKRKRSKTENSGTSMTSADTVSVREFRKSRRKLDESSYSLHSSINSTDPSQTSYSTLNTTSTGTTSRAIKLQFSAPARKYLKKAMPVKHIEKHAVDAEGNLKCHTLKPLVRSINRMDHALFTMNIRQVYSILGIALNLIGDDIQLCDLTRFIDEGHISVKNVQQYFPENIAQHCNKLLQQIQFYLYPTKYSDKVLRDHIGGLSKFINIPEFHNPNIIKLCERYVTELNLPSDITTYVERLVNLLPPHMRTRFKYIYPAYEARSMAYIIFVLKLLFGLDGHTEKLISQSAINTNQCLRKLSDVGRYLGGNISPPPLLFVWQDWVEYVEMRKIIVSHYSSNFCQQFNQCQSTEQILEQMEEKQRVQTEQAVHNNNEKVATENAPRVAIMHRIFQEFLDELNSNGGRKRAEAIIFPPSFTPAHSYFKRILLYCSNAGSNATFKIPEFMRIDHMQRTLGPYTHAKELKEYFRQHKWDLLIRRIPCTSQRQQVGIFRPVMERRDNETCTKKADFNISEKKWLASLNDKDIIDEIEFKTEYDSYEKNYMKKLQTEALKRERALNGGPINWAAPKNVADSQTSNQTPNNSDDIAENVQQSPPEKTIEVNEDADVLSMHSFEVFGECDMEPIKTANEPIVLLPRRDLNHFKLFGNLSDDDDDDKEYPPAANQEFTSRNDCEIKNRKCTLLTTNMDCWTLLGLSHNLTGLQKKILASKFPRSFFWLLETCAQSLNVDWCIIYEELLTIELMFAYGIEDLDEFQNHVKFKYNNPIKDFNMLINSYRELF